MVEERHELDVKPDKLIAEVRALRALVEAMLMQLPDLAIDIGVGAVRDHSRQAEARVRHTDNDRWRDYAAAVYEMAAELEEAADMVKEERAEGARITTIQPAPLPEEELRLRRLVRDD